jgi:hypothetical protein
MLDDEYGGLDVRFKWDYPATLEEAFEEQAGRCLPFFSRERHVCALDALAFRNEPSQIGLGIDWGAGESPFVAVWCRLWRNAQHPGFTVDPCCPDVVRSLLGWMRDPETGKPMDDSSKHAADALRYLLVGSDFKGHCHVYRQVYIPRAAALGYTHLSLAQRVIDLSRPDRRWPDYDDIGFADRAEPLTIADFNRVGIALSPYARPKNWDKAGAGALHGDIEQGIKRMHALMVGTEGFAPEDPRPELDLERKLMRRAAGFNVRLTKDERKMAEAMQADGPHEGDEWNAANEYLGTL